MESYAQRGLLPAGLRDALPPAAEWEAAVGERLLACLAGHGYQRVKPPLVEFEATLLAGAGAKLAPQTFRLMDPVSQRMMGVRPDITLQVARIAETRLADAPRPLRLSYMGQVLRVKGTQLRPERQFAQVGLELIGAATRAADIEVATLAAEALAEIGVPNASIDLCEPTLVPAVCRGLKLDDATAEAVRAALDQKDAAALKAAAGKDAKLLEPLLRLAGPAAEVGPKLLQLDLPAEGRTMLADLVAVADAVRKAVPGILVTIDAAEARGFEYQTGVSFTLFARGVRGELGRGGRYDSGGVEPSSGFTLYLDSVIRALPAPAAARHLYISHGTPRAAAKAQRGEGWRTVQGLEPVADGRAEAKRLGCSHVLIDGRIEEV
ncbi:ATP phosphoribosyltransferase regulatory subunit [Desertibaculum subflavum]|uniref:ATP phosphoribosyltransferase regulatory subunit n=1 Tax=Desertibaculum subflavum TaxID=2268458 RepID=UPI000E66A316